MKIAFWSLLHGTGTSSSLLAIATSFSVLRQKKIVVTQTHYNLNNLEKPLLGTVESSDFFRDTGIDALIRHFKSGSITKEHIENCSIKISGNLYLMAGTKINNREGFENGIARSMLVHILSEMEKHFDMVFIDTNSGNNKFSMKVIDDCDAVVVSLRQNRQLLDSFFEMNPFEGRKVFYLFSDYDLDSKYSLHNIRHLYKEINKQNSSYIPHDTLYMDAICDEKVLGYLSSLPMLREKAEKDEFFYALEETVQKLESLVNGHNSKGGK